MADFRQEEPLGKANDWRLFLRLWQFARPYRYAIFFSTSLLLAVSLLALAQPYLIKVAIDNYITVGRYEGLSSLVFLFLLVLLGEFLLKYVQAYLIQRTGQRITYELRVRLFSHLQGLPVKFFDLNPVGRIMTRLTTDVENLNEVFSSGLVVVFGDIFMLVGIVAVMVYMNPGLALLTFAVLPLLFFVTIFFRNRLRESHRQATAMIARINSYVQESLSGAVVTKLFVREARNQRKFAGLARDYLAASLSLSKNYALYFPTVEAIGALALASIAWYGGGRIIAEAITFGTLVAFIEYVHKFFNPIRDLSEKYTMMQSAAASAERVFKILDTPASQGLPAKLPTEKIASPSVSFEDVWFSYDGAEPVIKGVSLSVAPGETVALVGPTGAGKTTLVSLLVRFYEPQRGCIKIGGRDIREMDLHELRRNVAFVFQDPFLFSGDLESNIRLGNFSLTADTIRKAARTVHADSFISQLPQGYGHVVAQRGKTLSTGQRQLLCFARGLAFDSPILILDEATSSVDAETEALVRDAVGSMMRGQTSIVVAHRLSTVLCADRIVVLHKGRVVEEGTHQALLKKNGVYRKLCELQFGLEALNSSS